MIWKVEGKVSDEEFIKLYEEWLVSKGLDGNLIEFIYSKVIHETFTFNFLKSRCSMDGKLDGLLYKALENLNKYFDTNLMEAMNLGPDHSGRCIPRLTNTWIDKANEIFALLDTEQLGVIDIERLLYFVLALIYKSKAFDFSKELHTLVKAEVGHILEEIDNYHGSITKISFKIFLIKRGLWSVKSINLILNQLKELIKLITGKKFREHFEKQYSVIAESGLAFPPLVEQAFIESIASYTFIKQFIADSCNGYISQVEYIATHIESFNCILSPQEAILLELHSFLKVEAFGVSQQKEFMKGLNFVYPLVNCAKELAELFMEKRGNEVQVEKVITDFLKNYDLLLNNIISFIIEFSRQNNIVEEQKNESINLSNEKTLRDDIGKIVQEEVKNTLLSNDFSQEEIAADFSLLKQSQHKKRVITLKVDLKNNEIHMKNKPQNNSFLSSINEKSKNNLVLSKSLMKDKDKLVYDIDKTPKKTINKSTLSSQTKRPRNIKSPKQILDKLNKNND